MLSLGGRIDALSAPELASAIAETNGCGELVLDFSGVEYISSAGLREVVRARLGMKDKGSFAIVNVPADILDVFRMTGLYERLDIFE